MSEYTYPFSDEKGFYCYRTLGGKKVKIYEHLGVSKSMKESGKFPNKESRNKRKNITEEELLKDVSNKFNEDKIKEIEENTSKNNCKKVNDELLVEMVKIKGFSNKPNRMNTNEFEKYVKDTENVILYRGAPEETLVQLKDGEYYGGTGVYGSGYYFSEGERGKFETKHKYAKNNGTYIRATFDKKNMKTIDFEKENLSLKSNDRRFDYGINSKEARIINNSGRFALANDYDAIYVKSRNYYIILNRSKLIVEDKIRHSDELELKR